MGWIVSGFLFSSVSVVNLVVGGWVGRMDTIVSVVCFLSLA